jgi:hypothetical protein
MADEKARDNYNEAKDQSTVDNIPTFKDAENIQSIVAESGYFPTKESQRADEAKYRLSRDRLPGQHKPQKPEKKVEEQMTTQTQFPPLKSSGSTGNPNATPPAPDLRRNKNTD